jgi:transcriptional regulator with XRE-family HTH domain
VGADKTIGETIRAARLARGWSQARLAREVGIAEGRGPDILDRQSVYRWETARRHPEYWMPFLTGVLNLEEPLISGQCQKVEAAGRLSSGPTG